LAKDSWPQEIPTPQAWLEFDVDNVEKATEELESQGHRMLVKNKKEPWGQTVSRFITPERIVGRNHFHSIDAKREIASARPGSRSRHDVSSNSFRDPFGRYRPVEQPRIF
jgi:hypothetical protein